MRKFLLATALCLFSIPAFTQMVPVAQPPLVPSHAPGQVPPSVTNTATPLSAPATLATPTTSATPAAPATGSTTVNSTAVAPVINNTGPTDNAFAEQREGLLRRMESRIDEMQHKEQCIKAASDEAALKACAPNDSDRDDRDKDHRK